MKVKSIAMNLAIFLRTGSFRGLIKTLKRREFVQPFYFLFVALCLVDLSGPAFFSSYLAIFLEVNCILFEYTLKCWSLTIAWFFQVAKLPKTLTGMCASTIVVAVRVIFSIAAIFTLHKFKRRPVRISALYIQQLAIN